MTTRLKNEKWLLNEKNLIQAIKIMVSPPWSSNFFFLVNIRTPDRT